MYLDIGGKLQAVTGQGPGRLAFPGQSAALVWLTPFGKMAWAELVRPAARWHGKAFRSRATCTSLVGN